MDFRLPAHSGCKIELFRENDKFLVKKSSSGERYNSRILRQAKKQKDFTSVFFKELMITVKSPRVIRSGEDYFVMEYFNGQDVMSFFEEASIETVIKSAKSISRLIDFNISKCKKENFKKEAFLQKFYSIKDQVKTFSIDIKKIEKFFLRIPIGKIPTGFCHGDLTFSNMLFSDSSICIFDFFDTFYESPIQDMVKIRQDTFYNWTFFNYNGSEDKTRIDIIMKKIDSILVDNFKGYQFYNSYYRPFQIMNFMRILPYSKESRTTEYLVQNINKMVKKWI